MRTGGVTTSCLKTCSWRRFLRDHSTTVYIHGWSTSVMSSTIWNRVLNAESISSSQAFCRIDRSILEGRRRISKRISNNRHGRPVLDLFTWISVLDGEVFSHSNRKVLNKTAAIIGGAQHEVAGEKMTQDSWIVVEFNFQLWQYCHLSEYTRKDIERPRLHVHQKWDRCR